MNLLFLCSRNQWRSPTAEANFKDHPGHHARSAGLSPQARVRVSEKLILWADIIFCMEKEHRNRLRERFPSALDGKEIVVLDIPDDYQFMEPELVEVLKASVSPYLEG